MIGQAMRRAQLVVKTILRRDLDALDRLQLDHLKVEMLFAQARTMRAQKRREILFKKISKELHMHMNAEESVLYPMFEKDESFKMIVLEAYEEHKQVKKLLREIEGLTAGSAKFDAKFNLLLENIEHHVQEEEETFFPKIRRRLDRDALINLATKIRDAKREEQAAA